MITIGNRYEPIVDDLLGKFATEDPKEIPFVIEALKSITDSTQIHVVKDSLQDRVKAIQSLIEKPPIEVKSEDVGAFKSFVLERVSKKIEELSQVVLNVIPSFTNDLEVNKQIYKALIKLRKYELEQLEQERGALQLYTPLEGRSDFDSTVRFDAFAKVMDFLKDTICRSLLLMGDAGAGKTTFTYFLAESLWQSHEKAFAKDKPIPILIPLITIGDVEKNLISEHFRNRGLSSEEILLLKKHFSFIFILEGYDESNVFKNLYETNGLDQWKCKVITSCRSQALLNRPGNYRSSFRSYRRCIWTRSSFVPSLRKISKNTFRSM